MNIIQKFKAWQARERPELYYDAEFDVWFDRRAEHISNEPVKTNGRHCIYCGARTKTIGQTAINVERQ